MNITNQCPECKEPLDLGTAHAESGYAEEFLCVCGECGVVSSVWARVLFITTTDGVEVVI